MDALTVEGLKLSLPDFELEATFRVEAGGRAALVGPSGGGKTSLLRLIAGLDPSVGGRVRLGEEDLTQLPPEERHCGFVFQDQALFPALTVSENVAFPLRARHVKREIREKEVELWLKRVGLLHRADARVGTLSGGERQRVALARALIWKPKLWLLDEPFSSLDPSAKSDIQKMILELHSHWPVPMVFVTHDASDVAGLATQRLELKEEKGEGDLPVRRIR